MTKKKETYGFRDIVRNLVNTLTGNKTKQTSKEAADAKISALRDKAEALEELAKTADEEAKLVARIEKAERKIRASRRDKDKASGAIPIRLPGGSLRLVIILCLVVAVVLVVAKSCGAG